MKRQIVLPLLLAPLFTMAADATANNAGTGPLFTADNTLIYALAALAVVQVVFIVSLASIMRTLGAPGAWTKRLKGNGGRAALGVALLFLAANSANAQAYKSDTVLMSNYDVARLLIAVNVFLLVLLLAQLNLMRGLTRAVLGSDGKEVPDVKPEGPSWEQRIMRRLTRQVTIEQEQDILMHHEYDGIRELDNVLPPWWLWLFYGTIAWGIIYLIGVHVLEVIPDQRTEYANEVAQAKTDVAAYIALQGEMVDENTVTLSTEASVVNGGRGIFTQYCTPCHGADASGSETSVGPNLTDPYWIHGGGIKNVFHTISYGVPEKGMISWKTQLKPAEVRALACYILSLEGKGSATQKPPQGDLWSEPAPADSTAVGVDSTKVPVDTMRVAMQ
ncbi:MAG: cbb3-type cytochrome c oxidase N-terminal domain-containing protein [Flavobacteriales bacterium]